jgi:hypothetical protein
MKLKAKTACAFRLFNPGIWDSLYETESHIDTLAKALSIACAARLINIEIWLQLYLNYKHFSTD